MCYTYNKFISKEGSMKNKKIIIAICLIVTSIISIVIFANNNKLYGKWKISGFISNNELYSFDDFKDYAGIKNYEAYSYYSIVFKKNNKAIFTVPTYKEDKYTTIECNYEINKDKIILINQEEKIEAFKINGQSLENVNLLPFDVVWNKNNKE